VRFVRGEARIFLSSHGSLLKKVHISRSPRTQPALIKYELEETNAAFVQNRIACPIARSSMIRTLLTDRRTSENNVYLLVVSGQDTTLNAAFPNYCGRYPAVVPDTTPCCTNDWRKTRSATA